MNQTQVEDVISKLVPLTLELSARVVENIHQTSDGSAKNCQRIASANIENIRTMCDELLEAFRSDGK